MKTPGFLAALIAGLLLLPPPDARADGLEFRVLNYHDVRHEVDGRIDDDQVAVSTGRMIQHFEWLRGNGYSVVSVDDVLAARDGIRPLPERAVMLVFDDGYTSTFEIAFPLLQLYDYPAVVAVVTSWIDAPAGQPIRYGDELRPRDAFMTWEQAREMVDSGLVEIASHSHDLHHGILGNPQGNRQPAATTFAYDPHAERYETPAAYHARVRADLAHSRDLIEQHTGAAPRVMVWPFGAHNDALVELSDELGMPITMLTLDGRARADRLGKVPRYLISSNPPLSDLVWQIRNVDRKLPVRAVQVDLDRIHDPDPQVQSRNLDRLLDRIRDMRVTAVYLQAYADPDGDGVADAVYFPSRHLPTRADLFNRVAWQLLTRTQTPVYAWMPVMSFRLPDGRGDPDWYVHEHRDGRTDVHPEGYRRLSPYHPEARRVILEIYEDLARHASFNGLLLQDDALLSDFEDASPHALAAYRDAGLPGDIDALRADADLHARWSERKTEDLVAFTGEIIARVRRYQGELTTTRNLYAEPVLEPAARGWYAQDLQAFLDAYDHVTLMAYPYMERARDPLAWLERLVDRVDAIPGALARTVFKLQAVNWHDGTPVDDGDLEAQIRLLQTRGVTALGYYPDDSHLDRPALEMVRRTLSVRSHPYQP